LTVPIDSTTSQNHGSGTTAQHLIEVRLQGGPADFPPELRIHHVTGDVRKVKVPYYGGYEHFEPLDPAVPDVFLWTGRTRVAE
jgi:hypothetical protein